MFSGDHLILSSTDNSVDISESQLPMCINYSQLVDAADGDPSFQQRPRSPSPLTLLERADELPRKKRNKQRI